MRTLEIRLSLLALALAACGGTTGTVTVALVTSTGSHVLDAVQTIRLTVTEPHQVVEAKRTAKGFDLSFEFDSDANPGAIVIEGLDASGALVACGQSPGVPFSAITAGITVFVAAPNSISLSPVTLTTARSEIAGSRLSFGAVLAGGRAATTNAPTTDVGIYNAFNHTFAVGEPLPNARTGLAITTANNNQILMFGGTGTDTNPTGTLWQFDPTVAPAGSYTTIADQAGNARTGQLMLTVLGVGFPISGPTPLLFDGTNLTQPAGPALPAVGGGGVNGAAVFVGESIIQFANNAFVTIGPGRTSAGAATRPDGHVIVAGGGDPLTTDVLDINPDTGATSTVTGALSVPRNNPSVAATSRNIVVVGGTDASGNVIASADVLDATTLTLVTTLPIIPRTGTYAVGLPTDQVLIAGGTPASADLELFTPPPPTTP